jgi:tRNA pseudouridine13 synthase
MHAVTYQFITFRNMKRKRVEKAYEKSLRHLGIEMGLFYQVDFALGMGDLEGNNFEITVRNLKRIQVLSCPSAPAKEYLVNCDKRHIMLMVERVHQNGFINFYGEQRVGAPGNIEQVGVRAFDIGQAMLQQDFLKAIQLLMQGTTNRETEEVRRVRKAWEDSNGDPSVTLQAFKGADIMPRERAVLKGLNRHPNNPLEALRTLNYNMRMFYIHAYQSYIWNSVASKRIEKYGNNVVKGDLYFEDEQGQRDKVKSVRSAEEAASVSIYQVVLPLPGYDVQYPENEIGQLYTELLKKDKVSFERTATQEATAKGSYRKLVIQPRNLSVELDDSKQECESMKLCFQLPKGCYATMFLRELMFSTVDRSALESKS